MFRGNPAHTFYGTGPLADRLAVKWRFRMGTFVSHATDTRPEKRWSGTGWTGTAIFVDDKVNHLDAVAPLGVRCALAAWGYNGPREHLLAGEREYLVCRLEDVEARLFDSGGGQR